jgi:rod shape-determining protein MreD
MDLFTPLRLAAVLAALLAQTAWWGTFGGVHPDYLLAAAALITLGNPDRSVIPIWIGFGILEDLTSGGGFGTASLFFLAAGILVSFLAQHFMAQSPGAVAATAAGVVFLQALYIFLLRKVLNDDYGGDLFPSGFLVYLLLQVAVSLAIRYAMRRVPIVSGIILGHRRAA